MRIIVEVVKYGDLKPGDLFDYQKVVLAGDQRSQCEIVGQHALIRLDNEWPDWLKERQVERLTIEL